MANFSNKVVENWWALLRHLSVEFRLELASRLIDSLKDQTPEEEPKDGWKKLSGAWRGEDQSAEELINFIRESRYSDRQIESFD